MDASNRGIYDTALMGILTNEGQIYPFLDAIFDFLYRRTDFYRIKSSPSEKLGFPPGVARRIVRAAFESYNNLSSPKPEKKTDAAEPPVIQPEDSMPVATEVEVETTSSDDTVESTTTESVAAEPVETVTVATKSKSQCSQKGDADTVEPVDNAKADGPGASAKKAGDENEDPDYDPVQAKFQSHPESYNGAMRDNYCWSQSVHDLDVRVKVGPDVSSRNQVRVNITPGHLKVELLDIKTKTWSAPVDDDLHARVKLDESIWTLVPGDHVLVNLEKAQELWWDRLLVSEPQINIRAIDPTKPFEDLDEEAQVKIQQLTYNNLLKQAGKKTPQEEKVENLLREAWDKEGSPFKGQPFDPSAVNITGCDGSM
ncbi:nudC domain-containing protein 3 isoform X2 [Amblyomma americanum]